jgi:type II secretory ATPase GspE/PulE/Tfp pilus assembly ATPase PilB-like protein
MLGEVRDPETAETAVRAALTGHLVLTSIHTNDAPSALARLTDMGVPPYITSSGLLGSVAQRLARKLCPHCKEPDDVATPILLAAGFSKEEVKGLTIYRAVGCDECGRTGYRGRIGLFEVMEFGEEVQAEFLAHAATETLRKTAVANGMRTLRRDALDKVKAGVTSLSEIDRVVF